MIMHALIIVSLNIAAWEHSLDMLKELGVDRHDIFIFTVDRAFLNHPDLSIALDDLGFDLANMLVDEHFVISLAINYLSASFDHALGTEGISRTRPTQRGFALLP